MKLQGRNLKINLEGNDVKLLHQELGQIGYEIPDEELKKRLFGKGTQGEVKKFQKSAHLPVTGVVDEKTAAALNKAVDSQKPQEKEQEFSVSGKVVEPDGSPLKKLLVKAFDKGLGKETELGRNLTDEAGNYSIAYKPEQLSYKGKPGADLIVRVYKSANDKKPVAASPLILGAKPIEKINLVVGEAPYRGKPEYDLLSKKLNPEFATANIAELTVRDVAYLAKKLKMDAKTVARYIKASKLEKQTKIAAEIFYALFTQELPAALPALLAQDEKVLRNALKSAIAKNIIRASAKDDIDKLLVQFRDTAVEQIVSDASPTGNPAFIKGLLKEAGLSPVLSRKFLKSYVHHKGTMPEFWDALTQDQEFGKKKVEALQTTFQLGLVTQNHLPLVKKLKSIGGIKTAKDLVTIDKAEWLKHIKSNDVGAPAHITGSSDAEKAENYATGILNLIESAFPTPVLAKKLVADGSFSGNGFATFFSNNPDYEFSKTSVKKYLSANPGALSGINKPDAFAKELEGMERLFLISPRTGRFENLKALWTGGYRSAGAIASTGRGMFRTQMAMTMSADAIDATYSKARKVHDLSLITLVNHIDGPKIKVIPDSLDYDILRAEGRADLETLFGSMDFCGCVHCRSVLSPAAYLVDLLAFLKNARDEENRTTALDIFRVRRPDILHTKLSCGNTNTPMPYIDLVNEVLENAVYNGGEIQVTDEHAPGTIANAGELKADPEHVNIHAYQKLRGGKYLWRHPFNLWLEEVRTYLDHLGVPRHELMEVFSNAGELSALDIAAEYLKITRADSRSIELSDGDTVIKADEWRIIRGDAVGDLDEFYALNRMAAENELALLPGRLPALLEKAKLPLEELKEILNNISFVNPNGLAIGFEDDSCSLDEAFIGKRRDNRLTRLRPDDSDEFRDMLSRLHRFIRLKNRLQWSYRELNHALKTFDVDDFTDGDILDEFIQKAADAKRLQERFKVPVLNSLSWWGDVETADYNEMPSLYRQLFLSITVNTPVVSDSDESVMGVEIFRLNELEGTSRSVLDEEYVSLVRGAVNLNVDDLKMLVTEDDTITLESLSELYRISSFCRALKLKVSDYLSLVKLTGRTPVGKDSSPGETRRFVKLLEQIRSFPFSIGELDYLLREANEKTSALRPTDAGIAVFLSELRAELQKIKTEFSSKDGDLKEAVKHKLSLALTAEVANKTLKLIAGIAEEDEADISDFREELTALVNGDLDFIPSENKEEAMEYLASYYDNVAAESPRKRTEADRLNYLLGLLNEYLLPNMLKNVVIQKLSSDLSLKTEIAMSLLTIQPREGSEVLIEAFIEDAFIAAMDESGSILPGDFTAQFQNYRLLHKAAMALRALKNIQEKDIKYIFGKDVAPDLFNLATLPLELNDIPDLIKWLTLLRTAALNSSFFRNGESVFELLGKTREGDLDTEAFFAALSEATQWSKTDIEFLAGLFRFAAPEWSGEALLRIAEAMDMVKRIGASAEKVASWNTVEIEWEQALAVRNAAKAKHEYPQWLKVAPPLRDELRQKQRDALQAYLLANHPDKFQDVFSLYEHFLIDTEMSACSMTSRIKQAVASVQLFVQRILMNLEKGQITFDKETAQEWKWRKNYRVWEANRKVFLWPENWIVPELRLDKTPFFKDLENELLQDEVNDATAERAFLNYLEKLDEVARLDIQGMYMDEEQNTLHVFGRTKGTPPIYYYRKWIDESVWTPWERVDLDIQGDHLIPVVWNRRVYLFWPIFTEKAQEPTDDDLKEESENKKPKKYYEIQFAWSENKNGKWLAKKISKGSVKGDIIISPEPIYNVKKDRYFFIQNIDEENNLWIDVCYWEETPGVPTTTQVSTFQMGRCDANSAAEQSTNEPISQIVQSFMIPNSSAIVEMKIKEKEGSNTLVISLNEVNNVVILQKTPGEFTIPYPTQFLYFFSQTPFFYEDKNKTFLVTSNDIFIPFSEINRHELAPRSSETNAAIERSDSTSTIIIEQPFYEASESNSVIDRIQGLSLTGFEDTLTSNDSLGIPIPHLENAKIWAGKKFTFQTFYHPFTCLFIKQLNRYGIDGLLSPNSDTEDGEALLHQKVKTDFFVETYMPNEEVVDADYPIEEIDFEYDGSYSQYNWELFFHAPLLIACRLSQNQKFEEAHKWFHYIFNPTEVEGEVPQRFWKIKPFHEFDGESNTRGLLKLLNEGDADLERQVEQWEKHPFQPHVIATLRKSAYMKTVVMKYIDHLIAWGDNLFRRDTIESINEAAQLYILAAQILGRKPVMTEGMEAAESTFSDLEPDLDELRNALAPLEAEVARTPAESDAGGMGDGSISMLSSVLYFCVPANEKLLSYWDTVADRLFKIRHCMNIEGVKRQLPLFEPPIDPGMLVRAVAAGVNLSSALNDFYAPLPHYRFQFMLQKAIELCNDVKSLSASLLSAFEKKEGEELSLVRARNENSLLMNISEIKSRAIEEAQSTIDSLNYTKQTTDIRHRFYSGREYTNPKEQLNIRKLKESQRRQIAAQSIELAAASSFLIPDWTLGASGWAASPVATAGYGGANIGSALKAASSALSLLASMSSFDASMASIAGSYDRRMDEWNLQSELSSKELEQIEKQIVAAEIRKAIAEKDLQNHELQIEHAKQTEEFLKDKFTNEELYGWMVSQVSAIYFQSYQMAYDLAIRAEKAFRHELALDDATFIQFGYWDSLKKGLLAGERLHKDLKRMETAYLEQNRREFELTKHVSLMMLNPQALLQLREDGVCEFRIPETVFDLDYPGQYMRRIKSVSLTIPCVTGPYVNVSCKATLLSNEIRKKPDQEAASLANSLIGIQSIATSSAQNDSGLFEFSFRDERYLPFEGAGAISSWRLELPGEFRQFDYDTISDVILHINYTARDGGDKFKSDVQSALQESLNKLMDAMAENETGLLRLFSLKHEFPNNLHQLLRPTEGPEVKQTTLNIQKKHFPYLLHDKEITVTEIILMLKPKDKNNPINITGLTITIMGEAAVFVAMDESLDLPLCSVSRSANLANQLEVPIVPNRNFGAEELEDVLLLFRYTIS